VLLGSAPGLMIESTDLRQRISSSAPLSSNASDWSVPPIFPWTDTPPSGVTLTYSGAA
jgi:hypothetical protein